MYPLIKVREVTASKIYLLKIALSSLVRIIWADNKKEMDTASTFYLSIKCSIIHMAASAKDPPLKLTSMLIGISLIKILVFYKIFF